MISELMDSRPLWNVMLFTVVLVLLAIEVGYQTGRWRNPVASTGLALSFSVVMFLIADLDRPGEGLVLPDKSVMNNLDQRLNQ